MSVAARLAAIRARREAAAQPAPAQAPGDSFHPCTWCGVEATGAVPAGMMEGGRVPNMEPWCGRCRATTCESCQAPVVWVETAAGRRMPLDPVERRGLASAEAPENLPRLSVVDQAGRVVKLVEHPEGALTGRVSHFATCPNATQHRKPKADKSRPAERRVAALPDPELDECVLLCDQPQPLEPAGARCWVATTPQGPACTVLTDDGQLVHGYRVPEGWQRRDDLSLIYVGRCVAAVWVDAAGRWLTNELGRAVLGPAVGGGITLHREAQPTDQLVVVDAVPPALSERTL